MRTTVRPVTVSTHRVRNAGLVLVVVGGLAVLSTWHGSVLGAVVPVGIVGVVVVLALLGRRALRRASALIDTILVEELDPGVSAPRQRDAVQQEK